ncbi:hypothetical protein Tco_1465064 [Tanacetum coccineum]
MERAVLMLISISCRGKNKQGSILSEVTGSEATNSSVAGSCKMNELESDVVVLSLQDCVKSVEQYVSKKVIPIEVVESLYPTQIPVEDRLQAEMVQQAQ